MPGGSGRRGRRVTAAVLVAAGAVVASGLTASAGVAVSSTAKGPATAHAVALPVCLTGYHNSYEFYTWCQGASPASYRTIAYCANGQAVIGIEYADGSGNISYADCSGTDSLDSTLNTSPNSSDWGILECSNYNGSGTFSGYVDSSSPNGDISWILANWGGTNGVAGGGTALCDYSAGTATAIPTNGPVT